MSAEGVVAGAGAGSAERAYRRALLAYPRRYRRDRGEEIISTLLDAVDGGGAGAGDGAAPARADRREVAALLAGGLRRRLHPENAWWDGLRWAASIMVGFVVLRAMDRLVRDLPYAWAGGWLLPHGVDDLGWWASSPPGTVLLGTVAAAALLRAWRVTAWLTCGVLCAARIVPVVVHDRGTAVSVAATVAVWSGGSLALLVGGRGATRRSWAWTGAWLVAPLGLALLPPHLPAPELVLLALVTGAAIASAPVCRGLTLGLAGLGFLALAGAAPPFVAGPDALAAAVVTGIWALFLERVASPWLRRGRGGPAPA